TPSPDYFHFCESGQPRPLHSFPTRRSSDLPRTRARDAARAGEWRARRAPSPCPTRPAAARSSRSAPRAEWRWTPPRCAASRRRRSEEHTSELQSLAYLVCRLLLEKKKKKIK